MHGLQDHCGSPVNKMYWLNYIVWNSMISAFCTEMGIDRKIQHIAFLSAAGWVPEPGSINIPTPGHQGADAESVGCLHFLDLRDQKGNFTPYMYEDSWH